MLTRLDPFAEVMNLRDIMNRMLNDGMLRPYPLMPQATADTLTLPLNIHEEKNNLIVDANLPGFMPENIEVTVQGDTLTIRARNVTNEEETRKEYLLKETRSYNYTRTITLPTPVVVNEVAAQYTHGVLRLTLPKAEQTTVQPIKVTVGATP